MIEHKPPRFLRLPAVIERTGLGRDSIYRGAKRGTFPKPHRISDRASAWLESDVSAWIESRSSGSSPTTSAAA